VAAEGVGVVIQQPVLNDLCVAIVDCEHKTAPIAPMGFPSIRTSNIKNGRIDFENANRVSPETYAGWTQRMEPQPGDLILAREAPVGEVGLIPPGHRACLGQRTVLIRPNPELLDSRYLLYLLLTPKMRHEMGVRASGSTVAHLNMSDIRQLELPEVPPLDEQQAIASVLGSLDDKIELNRRLNRTLEQMAAAIFKAWFVDFEPVRAKASGAASFPGMPQPVFDALPATFAESELGPIPEGWEVKPLKDSACLTMGQSPKSEFYNTTGDGLPFHQGVTNYGERFPIHKTFCTVQKRLAEAGDILFSVRAPVGRINVADERLIVGRGLAAIRHNHNWQSFMLYGLKHQFAVEDSIGDGTIFTAVTKKDMEGIRIVEPIEAVGVGYESLASAIDRQIGLNDRESRTLTETRDALLPKLLSGEVRVNPEQ